jgi:FixJ family two-component response regulator
MTERSSIQRPGEAASANPIVFIVGNAPSVRAALILLIRSAGWRVSQAASVEEFLAHPRASDPCCLLTEFRLSGDTRSLLLRLIAQRPEVPVVCLSERADVQEAVQVIKLGAFGVLTQPIATELLLATIRSAIEQSRAAWAQLAEIRLLQERYACLTARERQVTNLVVSGWLNKQVAGELGITEWTVKAHRSRMMRKMRARSFAELVTMVDSLRRWAGEATKSVPWAREALGGAYTLGHSLGAGSSAVMSA